MILPEYDEMASALVKLIYQLGGNNYTITPKQAYRPLGQMFGLNEADMTRPRHDGRPGLEWENRVQWTRQRLINDGLLDGSVRGYWTLTEKGLSQASRQRV